MKQRTITAVIFGLIFFPAIIFGGWYFFCLSLIITFVSTYELMNMFYKKNEGLRIVRYIVPACSSLFFIALCYACKRDSIIVVYRNEEVYLDVISKISQKLALQNSLGYYGLAILVGGLFILIMALLSILMKNPGRTAINSIFSFLYGGVMMSMALCIEYVYPISTDNFLTFLSSDYIGCFAYLYTVVCLTDVFAYLTGYVFGKHKLCPTISPKKTVEGAIGGTVMGALVGTLVAYLLRVMPINSSMSTGTIILIVIITFVISILISIVSQFGDLFASVLKREYEIKDYGNILPGHGGMLDRFDSTALAGAFFFVVLELIKVIALIL